MLKRIAIALFTVVVLAYAGVLGGMYFMQRGFQYDLGGKVWALDETELTAQAVAIPTSGGAVVNGWYAPPQAGKPVILFYKGNSGSFSAEYERFQEWTADGYGFLAFDYRGFPASPGNLTQQSVLDDAVAAFDWLAGQGHPIVLWGRSLGSGPASYVASVREAEALLLETPFLSAVAVAGERYWFLPVSVLMHDQFPVSTWINSVDEPVFVAHGTDDQTIPVTHGQRLYELVRNKAGLWIEPGGTHGNLLARGLWDRGRAFFDAAIAATPPA